jgi:hypothetical protein
VTRAASRNTTMRAFGARVNSRVPLGSLVRAFSVMTRPAPVVRRGKSRPVPGSAGRALIRCAPFHAILIGSIGNMAPGLRELIALVLLAGLDFGLALARDDLFFAVVSGGATAITVIEAIRLR